MSIEVKIPPMGESISSGVLAKWHVASGAAVKPRLSAYVTNIKGRLSAYDDRVIPFYVMKSNGGVLSADEVVHSLIDALYAKTPVEEFQRRVRIHPNVAELLPTVLEALKPL